MRIFGIDPGIAIVGYCLLEVGQIGECSVKNWGSIQTDKIKTIPERLLEIHEDLKLLLIKLKPDVVAVEELFYFKNAKTVIPVMQARGVILLTAEMLSIQSYGYTPLIVKQVVTGYGRSEKHEVKEMIMQQLCLKNAPKLDDVVDAVAIAYCHYRQQCF